MKAFASRLRRAFGHGPAGHRRHAGQLVRLRRAATGHEQVVRRAGPGPGCGHDNDGQARWPGGTRSKLGKVVLARLAGRGRVSRWTGRALRRPAPNPALVGQLGHAGVGGQRVGHEAGDGRSRSPRRVGGLRAGRSCRLLPRSSSLAISSGHVGQHDAVIGAEDRSRDVADLLGRDGEVARQLLVDQSAAVEQRLELRQPVGDLLDAAQRAQLARLGQGSARASSSSVTGSVASSSSSRGRPSQHVSASLSGRTVTQPAKKFAAADQRQAKGGHVLGDLASRARAGDAAGALAAGQDLRATLERVELGACQRAGSGSQSGRAPCGTLSGTVMRISSPMTSGTTLSTIGRMSAGWPGSGRSSAPRPRRRLVLVDIADDRQHAVVGRVPLAEELDDVVERSRVEVLHRADGCRVVRDARPGRSAAISFS